MSNEHLWFGLAIGLAGLSPFSHVTAAFIVSWPKGVSPKPTFSSQLSQQNRNSSCLVVKRCVYHMIHPFGLDKL
jgi:hypothetical protein